MTHWYRIGLHSSGWASRALGLVSRLRSDAGYSMADQLLVSGFNFAVGIAAARILGVADFGLFTLILMITNLSGIATQKMLTMPMMTLAGSRPHRSNAYFAAIVRLSLVAGLIAAALVAATVSGMSSMRSEPLPMALIAASACLAFGHNVLLVVRHVLFARRNNWRALRLDLLRFGLLSAAVVAALLTGYQVGTPLLLFAIGASAFGIAIPALVAAMRVPVRRGTTTRLLVRHWSFSKWMLLMMVVALGQDEILWLVVGVELGEEAVGALRAGQYLLGMTHFMLYALEYFMPRNAAEAMRLGGEAGLRAYLVRETLVVGCVVGGLVLFIALFAEPLLVVSFGASYAEYSAFTRIFALAYMATTIAHIWESYLRTVERADLIFLCYVASSASALALIYPAVAAFGVSGFAWTVVAAYLVLAGTMFAAVAFSRGRQRAATDGALRSSLGMEQR